MGIVDMAEDWLFHKALGRAAVVVAQAASAYALAHTGLLSQAGVSVNIDPNVAAAGILGVLHVGFDYLKSKFPNSIGKL